MFFGTWLLCLRVVFGPEKLFQAHTPDQTLFTQALHTILHNVLDQSVWLAGAAGVSALHQESLQLKQLWNQTQTTSQQTAAALHSSKAEDGERREQRS